MLKLLIFDIGKVLVDYDWDSFCRCLARNSGAQLDVVRGFFNHNDFHEGLYERGAISTAQLVEEMNKAIGTGILLTEFETVWTEGLAFTENKDMTRLLEKLHGQCSKCILSNTNKIHYEYLHAKFGIAKHFDYKVLSYEVGMVKPEPAIYKEVLKRCNVLAESCLFIDDLRANIKSAKALGIQGHHFNGVESLCRKLRQQGLTV